MNKLIIAIAILSVCAAANIKCTPEQKKASFCTREYSPVCGIKIDAKDKYKQTKATYGNKCSACAEKDVQFFAAGDCKQYSKEAIFCLPDDYKNKMCTREYSPVCGLYDLSTVCISAPCGATSSNKCGACSNQKVTHFVPGRCEDQINKKAK